MIYALWFIRRFVWACLSSSDFFSLLRTAVFTLAGVFYAECNIFSTTSATHYTRCLFVLLFVYLFFYLFICSLFVDLFSYLLIRFFMTQVEGKLNSLGWVSNALYIWVLYGMQFFLPNFCHPLHTLFVCSFFCYLFFYLFIYSFMAQVEGNLNRLGQLLHPLHTLFVCSFICLLVILFVY